MAKRQKIASPKNRKDFEESIRNAFLAGCAHGYSIEHTVDMQKQETLGANLYLGKITQEEFEKEINELMLSYNWSYHE